MNPIPEFKPYGFRKDVLAARMRADDIQAILLTSPENVFYTTGYTVLPSSGNPILFALRKLFPFFSLIANDAKVTLGCWDFSVYGVQFGADQTLGFASPTEGREVLRKLLKEKIQPDCKLGIETTTPYYIIQILQEVAPTVRLVVADEYLLDMRLVKSASETGLAKKSIAIIEKTLVEIYDQVHIGMSRLELIQEAKTRLFKNGATGISHITFNFGKANPEIAIGEILTADQLVVLDLGGIYEGYASDNRRYAYSGEVPQLLKDHYAKMVSIVDAIGDALHPGTVYRRLFKLSRELFDQYGIDFGKNPFNHIGHNIGLETEEDWIGDDPDHCVKAGMVINIELYSIAPTGDHIGNEETYVIEDHGPVRISTLPREIHMIS